MLIRSADLDAIVRGEIQLAFRRWQRPTIRAGGTLHTVAGVLSIDAVEPIEVATITAQDAKKAGFADLHRLLAELRGRDGEVYRIALRYLGDDPRISLRGTTQIPTSERDALRTKLAGYDQRSKSGAWTERVLRCIARNPAVRAADLADELGYDKTWLKTNVRKLKALGLTESLEVGYRISPRGFALLDD